MQTTSAEIYLIDARCVDTRVAHSSLNSPSSSSLLPHSLPARPRAYSLSPLAPRQPLTHSPPTHLLDSTVGKQSGGGTRRRAATLDGSELMQHVSAALNHIAEESPVVRKLEGGAQPSDTACATVACSSQESSTVTGPVAGPADHRRRVIESMSRNVQTLLCDSLASDVALRGLDKQPCSVDTSLTSSCVGSEQSRVPNTVSQVSTTDWGNMEGSPPTTSAPTMLANLPSHQVALGVESVSCGVCPGGKGTSSEHGLAQSEEEEETQVDSLSVISGALEPHLGCLNLHSTDVPRGHIVDLGQSLVLGVAGEEDETASCQDEGRGGVAHQEEWMGGVAHQEKRRGGIAQDEGRRGVARQEEGREDMTHQDEGSGGVACQDEGSGGMKCQDEGSGGVTHQEEGRGGVACQDEGSGGMKCQEEERGGVACQEEGRGGVACQEEGRGGVVGQGESSIFPQLVLKDSKGASVPLCTECGSEPSFPLSPPLPPIGGAWHQTQAQTSAPGGLLGRVLYSAGSLAGPPTYTLCMWPVLPTTADPTVLTVVTTSREQSVTHTHAHTRTWCQWPQLWSDPYMSTAGLPPTPATRPSLVRQHVPRSKSGRPCF